MAATAPMVVATLGREERRPAQTPLVCALSRWRILTRPVLSWWTGARPHHLVGLLAKSIGTLTDLHPQQDLARTLQDAVVAARQLFDVDAAGVMLADGDGQLRWASASDQLAQTIEDNQEILGQGPCMDAFATARPAAPSAPWTCTPSAPTPGMPAR